MRYYKVTLSGMPRVLLALTSLNHYSFVYHGDKPEFEFTHLHKNCTMEKHYADGRVQQLEAGHTNIRAPHEQYTHAIDLGISPRLVTMIFTGYESVTETNAEEVIRLYQTGLPAKTSAPLQFCLPELVVRTPPKAYSLLQKMAELFVFGSGGKDLRMISCLLQLLAEFTETATMQAFQEMNSAGLYSHALYSNRVMQYVSEHISEKITVSDLADYVGISNEYLSRIFKNETGQTLISYINMVKLETIKELMDTQYFSLKEAGMRVGIENEAYLNRLFKQHTGVTSTEYRRLRQK